VVFFKLQLVLFFEGLRSERQLMRVVADRLSLRWYVGYDLSDALPDHSSLTRIRERFGLAVFRRFFEQIVEQCIAAGLVCGHDLYIDATKVGANADLDSLQPRFAVEAHLAQLFAADHRDAPHGDASETESGSTLIVLPTELTDQARADLAAQASACHDWLGRAGRPNRAMSRGTYRRTADFRVSTTDLDASPMVSGSGQTCLGYQDHYVVDGGRARITLAALVAPAEVQETQPALDLLWHVRFRWKLRPRQITGDAKYGTVANLVAIEDQRIRAYMPLSEVGRRPGTFGEQDFAYDAAADAYHCPGGQTLRFLSQCDTTRRRISLAPAATCSICQLRSQCTTSRRGRRISRSLDADTLDRVRGYHQTKPYATAMRKRRVWGEPRFAEAKDWHGLRRFRLRGLEKVNSEALLIAAGQNLKRLLTRWGWGRRPFPGGAAGVVLPDPSSRFALAP